MSGLDLLEVLQLLVLAFLLLSQFLAEQVSLRRARAQAYSVVVVLLLQDRRVLVQLGDGLVVLVLGFREGFLSCDSA
jgi:hypothetical protein